MPYAILAGSSSSGSKSLVIPSPPPNLQYTFIDSISVGALSAASANSFVQVNIPFSASANLGVTGAASMNISTDGCAVGGSSTKQVTFASGLQVRDNAGTVTISIDARPNGVFSTMECVVGWHWA